MQHVDYTYDVSGRLKTLNDPATLVAQKDLFGMSLSYDAVGNITAQNYATATAKLTAPFTVENPQQYAYAYTYDHLSRLLTGTLKQNGVNYFELSGMTYDENGNIKTLNRKLQNINADLLTYTYKANSNQIDKVEDTGNATFFENKNNGTTDYSYDPNGNTTQDKNKGISSITYNHLNLPKQLLVNTKTINYIYSATGEKLRMEVVGGDKFDYLGGIVYKNNVLEFIPTAEGRYTPMGGYEYNLNDHLGNLRVAFSCVNGLPKVTQVSHQDPWGLELKTLGVQGSNRFLVTGKEIQPETGLSDFGARMYDNLVPHFLGVDALSEQFYNLTPYNYVGNNPILMIDPDGMASTYNWGTGKYEDNGKEVSWENVQQEYGIGQGGNSDTGSEQQGGENGNIGIPEIGGFKSVGGIWYKSVGNGNFKIHREGIEPDYTFESLFISGKVLRPVSSFLGGILGRITGKFAGQEIPVIVGAVSGRGYTASQITKLFQGSSDDVYKFIYRGMTGSENGKGALYLAEEAAYAATYAKNGFSLATFRIPAQNFQLMVMEGFIETKMGLHGAQKGLEFVISNPAIKDALLKIAKIAE